MRDPEIVQRVEFYRVDLEILRRLGFSVRVATRLGEIPAVSDLYFAWWWTWAFLPLARARLWRRPLLVTGVFDHHWPTPGLDYGSRPWHQRAAMRLALRGADANVFVSRIEYDSVCAELAPRNPSYVPLAVDTELYAPAADPREELVATVAWMEGENARRKCLAQIVEAVPLVLRRRPGARFVLAGQQGTASPALASRVHELGVAHAVSFPGAVSVEAKIGLMRRSKVYLQPSVYEGFGLAILEAMSCGTAVVSSPAGEVPEVVGDAGLLVDGQSPEAIATAVLELLDDQARRDALAQRGRTRAVERFSIARRERGLADAIRTILPGWQPAGPA